MLLNHIQTLITKPLFINIYFLHDNTRGDFCTDATAIICDAFPFLGSQELESLPASFRHKAGNTHGRSQRVITQRQTTIHAHTYRKFKLADQPDEHVFGQEPRKKQ